MSESDEEELLELTGMTFPRFYHALRKLCRPPMVNIATLEVGELWYWNGRAIAVTMCVAEKSLLVTYDGGGPLDEMIADVLYVHAWLRDERPDPESRHSRFVFAATEEPSGALLVRHFSAGDWIGIITRKAPLPPTEPRPPSGWGR